MTDIAKLVGLLLRQADIAEATGKTYWAKTMREAVTTIESLAADAGRWCWIEANVASAGHTSDASDPFLLDHWTFDTQGGWSTLGQAIDYAIDSAREDHD